MIDIKVTFSDGDHLITGFNGTLQDAENYYIGQEFNHGDTDIHPKDKIVIGTKVELI